MRRSLPPPQPLSKDSHDTLVVPDDLALAAAAGATPVPAVTARPLTPGESAAGTTGSAAQSGGRRRRRRGWVIAILLLLAVGGAAAAGWYLAAGPGKQVTVPGILGLDEQAAATALQDVGLRLEVSGQEFSETVAAGLVLSSDPAPGASTGVDSLISVVLSQGPERYAVPDVVGEPLAIARTTLSEANLGVGIITEDWDSSIAAGSIVSTVPGVGEELMSGTLIDIVVSKGPKPVKIPGLTGVPADEASAQLEAAGLIVTTSEEFSGSIASGLVISTSPDKGARVDVGGTVELVVSKGPPPVEVPFLIDMIKEDAVALLQSLGLNVDINEPPFTPLNRVIAQDPSSGTLVPAGSTVTITII